MCPSVFVASDFTGLIEYFVALVVWCLGGICAITAIALLGRRNPRGGQGDSFAFLAIISSVIIMLILATVWAHYERVDALPLLAALLPGVVGVLCLVATRPRRR